MYLKVKQGDILSDAQGMDAKVLVAYDKEGGIPLFVIMDHGGAVYLCSSNDKEFPQVLRDIGL
jgi:uncharacterized protein YuzE